MEQITKDPLLEATVETDIADTDENLSIDGVFQQGAVSSLMSMICSIAPIHGPTGKLFNIKRKAGTDDFELVKSDALIHTTPAIKTGFSQEAYQDILSQYGGEANKIVGKIFRSISNEKENEYLLAKLDAVAKDAGALVLTDAKNAESNLFEVTQKVHELVLAMNSKNFRTYQAFAVLPAKSLASIMALSNYAGALQKNERGLFISQIGQTKFYMNPNPLSDTAYVGLKDAEEGGRSSLTFSPYMSEITSATDPDTGNDSFFIHNRFALTVSPLHEVGNEMLYKFVVS